MTARRPPLLIATVGLPGSGKTSWARGLLRDPHPGALIERDQIRDMLGYDWTAGHDTRKTWEDTTTAVQHTLIGRFLNLRHDVIVADTNLADEHLNALHKLAVKHRAAFSVRDFTHIPLGECIRRDAQRPPYEPGGLCSGRSVGAEVIRRMWEKYQATHPTQEPTR